MRTRYVRAMTRERTAWREFVAAAATTPDARVAYERWQAAEAERRQLAALLLDAGLCPPDAPLASSTSLGRRGFDVEPDFDDLDPVFAVATPGNTHPN